MIIMEITNKKNGMSLEVEYFNSAHEARQRAIRLTGYAGYLNFVKDRDGDSKAENRNFKVDLVRA